MSRSTQLDRMQDPTRCTARRKSGEPCRNHAIKGSNVCRMHGGAAPQVRRAAEVRLLMASDGAVAALVSILRDSKAEDAVKVRAATAILDRAGLGPKQEIDLSVRETQHYERVLEGVLVDVDELDDDIEDAVVIDYDLDEPEQPAPVRQRRPREPSILDIDPDRPARRLDEDELRALERERIREEFAVADDPIEPALRAVAGQAEYGDFPETGKRREPGDPPRYERGEFDPGSALAMQEQNRRVAESMKKPRRRPAR